jgi:hypothetical protein
MDRSEKFHREMDRLESHLPDWAKGAFRRARTPQAMWMRLTVVTLLIVGGILGVILPVLGFWMVPLGLALLAIDVPVLRGPFARLLAFINRKLASQVGWAAALIAFPARSFKRGLFQRNSMRLIALVRRKRQGQKSESACGNAGNVLEIFPAIAAARTDRLDSFRMRY